MGWLGGIVVYILLWWWVLFMTLPFGAKPSEVIGEGHAQSAPAKPYIGRKLLITSLISVVLWGGVYVIIDKEWLSFRDMARDIATQDR